MISSLSVKQVAKQLKIDESNVRRKIHANEFQALKKGRAYISTHKALNYYHFMEEQNKAIGSLKKSAKTISFVNHKGGCSKTTSAYNVAGILSKLGNKVLLVDIDPQGNSSQTCLEPNVSADGIILPYEKTIKDLLIEKKNTNSVERSSFDAVIKESYFGFDVIPCDLSLNSIIQEIEASAFKEVLIRETLKELQDEYDYIIIDTPPTLGFNVVASLTASDYVVLVTVPEAFSIIGIEQTINLIDSVRRQNSVLANPKNVEVLGVVISKAELNTNVAKHFIGEINEFGEENEIHIFEDVITKNIKVPETQALQKLITDYDPSSDASLAYFNISLEIDEKVKKERIKEKLS